MHITMSNKNGNYLFYIKYYNINVNYDVAHNELLIEATNHFFLVGYIYSTLLK